MTRTLDSGVADLFSEEVTAQGYSTREQIDIEWDALQEGERLLQQLSRGEKPYRTAHLRSKGYDGKFVAGETYVDQAIHEYGWKNPGRLAEVALHEAMHGVLSTYDLKDREHPEGYAHKLTGLVLQDNLQHKDPSVRNLARKALAEYQNRMAAEGYGNHGERYQRAGGGEKERGGINLAAYPLLGAETVTRAVGKFTVGNFFAGWLGQNDPIASENHATSYVKDIANALLDGAEKRRTEEHELTKARIEAEGKLRLAREQAERQKEELARRSRSRLMRSIMGQEIADEELLLQNGAITGSEYRARIAQIYRLYVEQA
ncbi:MAG: hypothetical protein HY520_02945 [Candidatus Aenigmarchaeota archaeon]|nr:hypothetical protein [Candidatus Aenigmarchaeota archaeon]